MKLTTRLLGLGALVILALGIILFGLRKRGQAESEKPTSEAAAVSVETVPVIVGSSDTVVSAQGTLAPGEGASAHVATPTAGRIVAVRVREGDTVTAGQVVALIDSRALQAQSQSAAAALTASQAQAREAELTARAAEKDQKNSLHTAQLAYDAACLDRDHAVKQAKIALRTAENDLKKVQAGARPQEIAQAEQAVAQATVTRDRAATEVERVKYLFEHGVAPKRQLDDATTALAVANSALESARQQADLLHTGARSEDVQGAKLNVENAQQALEQAETSGEAHVAQAKAALEQAQQSGPMQLAAKQQDARAQQATSRQKVADFTVAQTTAAGTTLRAPLAGTVTRRLLNPGDMADPSTQILEIANTRALNLQANLPAEDGLKVRPGMPVRLSAADQSAHGFSGRVLSLGQIDPQTNLMSVRITVANPNGHLKVGLFTSASIILRTNPAALLMPKTAVITREGKTLAFTCGADGKAHQHVITLGNEQGDLVEIRTGLAAGDQVIRLGQYELTDGAPVKSATAGKGE